VWTCFLWFYSSWMSLSLLKESLIYLRSPLRTLLMLWRILKSARRETIKWLFVKEAHSLERWWIEFWDIIMCWTYAVTMQEIKRQTFGNSLANFWLWERRRVLMRIRESLRHSILLLEFSRWIKWFLHGTWGRCDVILYGI